MHRTTQSIIIREEGCVARRDKVYIRLDETAVYWRQNVY